VALDVQDVQYRQWKREVHSILSISSHGMRPLKELRLIFNDNKDKGRFVPAFN
jgi:hypothetical protein